MTPEEAARMAELCRLIADANDHDAFMELLSELDDLLARKEATLNPHSHKPKPN